MELSAEIPSRVNSVKPPSVDSTESESLVSNADALPRLLTPFSKSPVSNHDSVYSYDDDCFAALSEHGDAAYADCGEERDY